MKISGGELEKKAVEALDSCLSRVRFLKIEEIKSQASKEAVRPDFLVKLTLPKGEKYLVVEIKTSGQPRLAREAVNQTLRYRDLFRNSYGVFLAPYISPKAGEICPDRFFGAARLSPAVWYQRAFAYVEQDDEDLLSQKALKRITSGANLSLLSPHDSGVFYGSRVIDGIRIASPIQVYLDLSGFRGRGEEAANALLDQVIRPAW